MQPMRHYKSWRKSKLSTQIQARVNGSIFLAAGQHSIFGAVRSPTVVQESSIGSRDRRSICGSVRMVAGSIRHRYRHDTVIQLSNSKSRTYIIIIFVNKMKRLSIPHQRASVPQPPRLLGESGIDLQVEGPKALTKSIISAIARDVEILGH